MGQRERDWSVEELYTWGMGKYGQLGHGDETDQITPKQLDRVVMQGSISQLSCGFCFNVALTIRGDVYTWGYGKNYQLGHQDHRGHQKIPRKLKFFSKKGVKYVAAGREHAVAILETGEVYTWGAGKYGCLGHGDQDDASEPRLVEYFLPKSNQIDESYDAELEKAIEDELQNKESHESDEKSVSSESELGHSSGFVFITQVACGLQHTLALNSEGNVYTWGLGQYGRLGHGGEANEYEPRVLKSLAHQNIKVEVVRCGWDHSAVITKGNGHVYTWGCGRSFQLGGVGLSSHAGTGDFQAKPTKVIQWNSRKSAQITAASVGKLSTYPQIIDLACGGKHNLAVTKEGAVYSWGRGEFGRLGHGDLQHRIFPTMIHALEDIPIQAVAGGGYHSMALAVDGTVYAWGSNERGRLGLGNTSEFCIKVPKAIPETNRTCKARIFVSRIHAGAYLSMMFGEPSEEEVASGMAKWCHTQ